MTVSNLNETENFVMDSRISTSINWDDATWILASSFIIFTMQSGFGLLESGLSDTKNEVDVMVKNAVDVIFGGLSFWIFGFGLCFGKSELSNAFVGVGYFFVHAKEDEMGFVYSWFFFQLAFATTATTIVSGAMVDRMKLTTYIVYSLLSTLTYSFPAHWLWAENGILNVLGAVDVAGAGPVHLVGGVSGLVATLLLGPRTGRFDAKDPPPLGSPTNAILGMFMLWWGWLGFNCGSTFGISGGKWKLAACAAVSTLMSSISGGAVAFILSYARKRKYDVGILITGLLAALVSSTASCAITHPWEAVVIGAIGSALAILSEPVVAKLGIDDPVAVIPVHCVGGIWSLLSTGLLIDNDTILGLTKGRSGLLKGGSWYLFGIQSLTAVIIIVWTLVTSVVLLKGLDVLFGLRLSIKEELLGSDFVEHGIKHFDDNLEELLMNSNANDLSDIDPERKLHRILRRIPWRRCFGLRHGTKRRKHHSVQLRQWTLNSHALSDAVDDTVYDLRQRQKRCTTSLEDRWI